MKVKPGSSAAYDAALKLWPVPYEELDIPTRFGMTHVVAAGPPNAPVLVLLHGYMATSVMWAPNIADFSRDYRVYAIDIMGQPSKSVPGDSIRDANDYVAWLTATLDGLDLGRVSLVGMSFGGWIALHTPWPRLSASSVSFCYPRAASCPWRSSSASAAC